MWTHLIASVAVVVHHAAPSLAAEVVLVRRLALRVPILARSSRRSIASSLPLLLHLLQLHSLLLKLLPLAILRDLGEQLE